MANIKTFDLNLLKLNEKSCKDIDTYYIGYIAIKKIDNYENIYSVYPFCLIIDILDGPIEEKMELNT